MPSIEHELFTELFRDDPTLALDLLDMVADVDLPRDLQARLASPDLTQCVPTEYRADAVVELARPDGNMAIVVEVQRARDPDKHWTWPVYLATLRSRLKRPAFLLVICTDEQTAGWCCKPIDLGHPEWALKPLVVGQLHPIHDRDIIARHPELALLAAIGHPRDEEAIRSIPIALETLHERKKENARLYADYVFAMLPEMARAYLEELMTTGTYEYKSDFARGYFADGEAQGKAEGKAGAVLQLLSVRGVEVPDETRETILGCTDLAQLDAWFERAVTAATVDDLFT